MQRQCSGTYRAGSERHAILVVEDDEVLGRVLARMLRGHGVIVERDPSRALEMLSSGDWFDFVLLDLHLPGIDGETLASAVKFVLGDDAPTVALMSGYDVTGSFVADAVLLKPFTNHGAARDPGDGARPQAGSRSRNDAANPLLPPARSLQ